MDIGVTTFILTWKYLNDCKNLFIKNI